MQKSTLFTSLSFLLKVQFVRQLASFSKDVCNLLVAANPAFIQQESAAVFPPVLKAAFHQRADCRWFFNTKPKQKKSAAARNGRQLAFYQIMLTCFSVSVIAFSAAVPYN